MLLALVPEQLLSKICRKFIFEETDFDFSQTNIALVYFLSFGIEYWKIIKSQT